MVLAQLLCNFITIISGKLLTRANKVAHMLLTKLIPASTKEQRVPVCKSGDRVALVYPNTEPLAFITAFYGCLLAGVVPVPVEVPLTKRVCVYWWCKI
jgi:acyl-CoA synthetase (AMP-forming)/AMP-acid ligase II